MKTTLKRGMGRGASVNGNGRAVFPPGVHTPMRRYRQPEPPSRGVAGLIGLVFAWTVLAAVIVVGGIAGAVYLREHRFVSSISVHSKLDKKAEKKLDVAIPGQPTTALVIGTDKRLGKQAEETGRSDTILLVRADPGTKSISLLSFPRDLIVTVKCPGQPDRRDRINSAFSACGPVGTLLTVRALTGVPINYFITVNFRGFMRLSHWRVRVPRPVVAIRPDTPDVTPTSPPPTSLLPRPRAFGRTPETSALLHRPSSGTSSSLSRMPCR